LEREERKRENIKEEETPLFAFCLCLRSCKLNGNNNGSLKWRRKGRTLPPRRLGSELKERVEEKKR